MTRNELLPCPFCGGEAGLVPYNDDTECDIVCKTCKCRTWRYSSIDDANSAWNRRTPEVLRDVGVTDEVLRNALIAFNTATVPQGSGTREDRECRIRAALEAAAL